MGGLIGVVTNTKDGLFPKEYRPFAFTVIGSNPIIKLGIETLNDGNAFLANIVASTMYISRFASLHLYVLNWNGDGARAYKLCGNLPSGFKMYYKTDSAGQTDVYMTATETLIVYVSPLSSLRQGSLSKIDSLPDGCFEIAF